MADYFELPGLEELYLEDSWLRAVVERDDELRFELEAVLTERHPAWQPRRAGEQYCYRNAAITFRDVERSVWLARDFQSTTDLDGSIELGNIDTFTWESGTYELQGDGWHVQVRSSQPPLVEIGGPPKFSFAGFRETVEILTPEQAVLIRQQVLAHHLEAPSDERTRRLGSNPQRGDETYRGHVWDCLAGRRRATEAEIWDRADRAQSVYVMWDLHEVDRVTNPDYFRFPIATMLRTTPQTLRSGKHHLPDDLYIFESPTGWIAAFTHENIDGEPYCVLAG